MSSFLTQCILLGMLMQACLSYTGSSLLDGYNISYKLEVTLSIDPTSTEDLCTQIVSTNNSVYHRYSSGPFSSIQQWQLPFVSASPPHSAQRSFPFSVRSFWVDYNSETFLVFNRNSYQQYTFADINTSSHMHMMGYPSFWPTHAFINNNITYRYGFNPTADYTQAINLGSGSVLVNTMPLQGTGLSMSPDFTKAVLWEPHSKIHVYNVSGITFTLVGTFTQSQTVVAGVIQTVTFSRDSSLAIIQTDGQHPIFVLNLATMTVWRQFPFSGAIRRALFLADTHIIVMTASALYAISILTSNTVLLASLNHDYEVSKWDPLKNNLYMCKNSQIKSIKISSSPISEVNSSTSSGLQKDEQVILQLQMSESEKQATQAIASGLSYSSSVIDTIILVALSNPFTYYFISFINFFTICSHYVLLKMPIPQKLYEYLSRFYTQINHNILSRVWRLPFNTLSEQKVNREKLRDLGLTTDFAVAQTSNLCMAAINIVVFQVLSCLVRRLSKHNFIRRALEQPQSQIIFGQYIALIMPLTAPWVFFIYGGYQNTISQINIFTQYLFFGVSLGFIAYYLIQLMKSFEEKAKNKKYRKRMKNLRENIFMKQVQKEKSQSCSFSKQKSYQESTLALRTSKTNDRSKKHKYQKQQCIKNKEVVAIYQTKFRLSAKVIEQWYVVLCNMVYPLLLVVSNVEVSLPSLLLFSLAGVFIALSRSTRKLAKINKVVLASYHVLFYFCFIIFRLVTHNQTLVYAQIACLSILLIGSVHQVLFLVFQLFINTRKIMRSTKVQQKDTDKSFEPAICVTQRLDDSKYNRDPLSRGSKADQIDPQSLVKVRKQHKTLKQTKKSSFGESLRIKRIRKQKNKLNINYKNTK